ncbi:hypothetical protein BDV95DRAFT_593881 [Massariosphaeria phaeospora]|uniref:F-box domain-containing protein n=1 Tax=Massariosphaeria phaeospora TaxID=100035 RepID=A0A7C8MQG9_9PLEO|nr:hypothetical protein BDV95DRAFT_593881 [Massariosphaeria phaeospora]
MAHSPLLDPPAELLHHALSYFDSGNEMGREALYNLCLASRILRDIAQPILFSHLEIFKIEIENKPDAIHCTDEHAFKRQLVLFLRTVIERPDLATRVLTVNLLFGHKLTNRLNEFLQPDEDRVFSEAAAKSVLDASAWNTQFPSRGLLPLLALLFRRLRNLQNVVLQTIDDVYDPTVSLPVTDDLQQLLPSIKKLHLVGSPERPTEIIEWLPFLALDTLRTLHIDFSSFGAWDRPVYIHR